MVPSPDKITLEGLIEKVSFKTHKKFGPTTSMRIEGKDGVCYIMGIVGTFPFMAGNKVKLSYSWEDTPMRVKVDYIEMYDEKGASKFKMENVASPSSLYADVY